AKVTASAVPLFGVAKLVAVGAISGAVALGAAQKVHAPRLSVSTPTVEVVRAPARRAPPSEPVTPPSPGADVPSPPPIEEPIVDVAQPTKGPPVRSAPLVAEPLALLPSAAFADHRTNDTASLVEEVALLDRAREALVAGDPRRALAALDAYERARVGTRLAAEATLLRIEGLLASGDRARAASLAAEFLRAHPERPVAGRMRT